MKPIYSKLYRIVFLIYSSLTFAQIAPYTISTDWYFGTGGRLRFPSGSFPSAAAPTPFYNSANVDPTSLETSTSLTFPNGTVALYSNSKYVFRSSALIPADNITNLLTNATCATSSSGAAVTFPDPASPQTAFYLVTGNDITGGQCPDGGINLYRYTVNAGLVTQQSGPVLLVTNDLVNEALTAGADGNGGYWLVCHDKYMANTFRTWHFTSSGYSAMLNQDQTDLASNANLQSYLKFSPCMDKIAFIGGQSVVVYSFDKVTGTIGTELRRVNGLLTGYSGLEFSPDGQYVYYSRWGTIVNYLNISSGASGTIAGSHSWTMQLGPDGNLYTSPDQSTSVGYIQNPNTPATATYNTTALPGPAKIISGLTNNSWLNPGIATLKATPVEGCETFSHTIEFKNYYGDLITIDAPTAEFSINGGAWTSLSLPDYQYTPPGANLYTIKARFKDAYCGQTWYTNEITINPADCALPLDYLFYKAKRLSENEAGIYWSTVNEVNTSHFLIERSSDGIHFEYVGTVQAKGTNKTVSNYDFVDSKAPSGVTYYRLIQVDQNGSTRSVILVVDENVDDHVLAYPNPFTEEFHLVITNAKGAKLEFTDVAGHLFYSASIESDYFEIDLGKNLASGAYFARVYSNDRLLGQKMIKKN